MNGDDWLAYDVVIEGVSLVANYRNTFALGNIEIHQDDGFRATLCRCGASKNKPWCDGSHKDIDFKASGEPATIESEPLAVRDGPIDIELEKNGPLRVRANLEICTGTGRTVDRVSSAKLCRCGASRTKPFCDNTHIKIGFKTE